jgi:hypothetical protein
LADCIIEVEENVALVEPEGPNVTFRPLSLIQEASYASLLVASRLASALHFENVGIVDQNGRLEAQSLDDLRVYEC